ncbi:hypothetical protein CJ026_001280 [Ralstonia pickettii]|nr:hypothetical protein [Ralstonia sp.]POH85674.1 hypothetical protein CJ026_001280 [Ralstonia pickettii]
MVPVAVELFALVAGALSLVPDGAPVTCANTALLPRATNIAAATQNARAEYGVRCIMSLS